ncbi:MAG: hypothetical protein AB7S74_19150 [Hyphomicrobium sp.]
MTGKPDDEVLGDYPGGDQSMGQLMPQLTPEGFDALLARAEIRKNQVPARGVPEGTNGEQLSKSDGAGDPRIES